SKESDRRSGSRPPPKQPDPTDPPSDIGPPARHAHASPTPPANPALFTPWECHEEGPTRVTGSGLSSRSYRRGGPFRCCTPVWIWGENPLLGGLCWLEGDCVSEPFELADEAARLLLGVVATGDVVGAEVGGGGVGVEDRVGGEQDRVAGGAGGGAGAAAALEAGVAGGEVGALAACGCLGRLGEAGAQPLRAFAGAPVAALAAGLVVAG